MKSINKNILVTVLLLVSVAFTSNAQSIDGYFNVCPNTPYYYFVEIVGGFGYKWTATGGTINGSSTSPSVSVNWSTAGGSKQIKFKYFKQGQGWVTLTQTIYLLAAGNISGNQTKCQGSSGSVSISGAITGPSNWQKQTWNGSSWSSWGDLSGTSNTYSFSNIQQTTRFRAEYGNCNIFSSYTTVTVNPTTVGGSISNSGSDTGCGSISTTLTLSGHTGSVLKWQKTTNEGISWTNITNTSTTYNVSGVTQATMYRAQVKSGLCSSKYSSTKTVYVNQTSIGGTISGAGNHCQSGSGTLTLSGKRGNVQKWEKKVGSGGSWTNITNTSTTQSYSNVTTDTYYRAYVKNGVCGAVYSNTVMVNVDAPTVAGSISGNISVCNSGDTWLTLSGHTGSIIGWDKSTNGGSSWTAVGSTSATITVSPVSVATEYRAIVKNGYCSYAYPSAGIIPVYTPSDGGSVSGGTTACGSASGTLTLSGHTGAVQKWQFHTYGGSWTDIANTAGMTTYDYSNNSVGTYTYRAEVQNSNCTSDYSTTQVVTVNAETVAGITRVTQEITPGSGDETSISVCKTTNVIASITDQVGNVLHWESSGDGGNNWTTIANTTTTYSFSAFNDVQLRAYVENGNCPNYSATATVNVDNPAVAGTISGGGTFCTGANGTLTLSGHTGSVVWWSYSEDGGSNWTNIANSASPILDYNNLTTNTQYKATVQNGVCLPAEATVTVDIKSSVPGTLAIDNVVGNSYEKCGSLASGLLRVTGANRNINKFETSTDSVNWATWGGELVLPHSGNDFGEDSVDYSVYNERKYYRAEVQLDDCPVVYTNAVQIESRPDSEADTIRLTNGTTPIYLDQGIDTLEVAGTAVGDKQWQFYDGSSWIDMANRTNDTLSFNITDSISYRLKATNYYCPWDVSNPIHIDVWSRGTITTAQSSVAYGEDILIDIDNLDGKIIDWEVSFDGGTNFEVLDPNYDTPDVDETYPFTLLEDTKFRALLDVTDLGTYYSDTVTVTVNEVATPKTNYDQVKRTAVLEPITVEAQIPLGTDTTLVSQAYFDGLGRTLQTVTKSASPTQNDLTQINVYDQYGRQQKQYMPYATSTMATHQFNISKLLTEQAAFYNNVNDDIADSNVPFSEVIFEDSPLQRITEAAAPGDSWKIGSGHTVKYAYRTNVANEVRQWKSDGTSAGFYPADVLWVSEVTDENGHKTQSFSDKSGRTVMQRRELGTNDWAVTTPVYDLLGRMKYTISPEGMEALAPTGSVSLSAAFIDDWVFTYAYDDLGRVTEKKVPGAEVQYFIYDNLDRIVLTQDGNLRADDQWTYVKYDQFNRVVMTGLYTNTTTTTAAGIQALLDAETAYHEADATTNHGYTNLAFPTTGIEVLTVSYFDDYDFDNNGTADYSYVAENYTGEPTPFSRTRGLSTGGKVRILGATDWLASVVFYDKYGRAIQAQGQNHFGGTDRATTQYDFAGRALKSWQRHHTATDTILITNRFDYDHAGRILEQYQQLDSEAEILLSSYSYNDLGQLIDKKIHSTDNGTTFEQSLDFTYNIRGWLTALNDAALTDVETDSGKDLWGMELGYEQAMTGMTTTKAYNGNISGVKWSSAQGMGETDEKGYAYEYDKMNRFTAAQYYNKASSWASDDAFSVEAISYDHNGNIEALERNHWDGTTLDSLTYSYNGNQLLTVADAAVDLGFKDGNTTGDDYLYDANGNLTEDKNKGLDSIAYNHLNLPVKVTKADSTYQSYTYTASGTKLAVASYSKTDVLLDRTDYLGAFLYKDSVLQSIQHADGRIIATPLPGGAGGGFGYEHQYHIKDHQGNIRLTFTTEPNTFEYLATMETARSTEEESYFSNIDVTGVVVANYVNHTDTTIVSSPNRAIRINNAVDNPQKVIGAAIPLQVFPGDTIKAEVFAKYANFSSTNDAAIGQMAGFMTSAFGLPTINGETTQVFSFMEEAGFLGLAAWNDVDETVPRAYLNYILMDKNFEMVDFGFQQVSDAAEIPGTNPTAHSHEKLSFDLPITEEGYIYLYVSNESTNNAEVYFDDFKVTHTESKVVQSNDFYPFGLNAESFSRTSNIPNKFLYNAGAELNETSGNYETFYRHYDPVLGRFNAIDPLASQFVSWTPYHYGYSNPITFNDPLGDKAAPTYEWAPSGRFGGGGSGPNRNYKIIGDPFLDA
ncbi:MAG: DUF6443 domain-containing protein, partial [Reichenbachiella sp.]